MRQQKPFVYKEVFYNVFVVPFLLFYKNFSIFHFSQYIQNIIVYAKIFPAFSLFFWKWRFFWETVGNLHINGPCTSFLMIVPKP